MILLDYGSVWQWNLSPIPGLGKTKANLHYDANENLMFMVKGTKKWTLFEPEQSKYLYEGYCKEAKLKYFPSVDGQPARIEKNTEVDEGNSNAIACKRRDH